MSQPSESPESSQPKSSKKTSETPQIPNIQESKENEENAPILDDEETKNKQQFLRVEILEKGFDPNKFVEYISGERENGHDIDNWSFEDLEKAVREFCAHNTQNEELGRERAESKVYDSEEEEEPEDPQAEDLLITDQKPRASNLKEIMLGANGLGDFTVVPAQDDQKNNNTKTSTPQNANQVTTEEKNKIAKNLLTKIDNEIGSLNVAFKINSRIFLAQ